MKDGCVRQQAMMSMQSGDADEPHQQMTDGVPQQGTAYTRTTSLNLMRSCTFSQCNCVSSGVMRPYVNAENTSRLRPFGEMEWNASRRCVTVVQPLQNERRNQ